MGFVVLKNIHKSYDVTVACTDINLAIEQGEFFTFLGPSGCGKTTILRLIAGFIQPDKGRIFLGKHDITRLAAEKRKTGMVFQNYALFPFMTVCENIEYGLKIQKRSAKEIHNKREHYLNLVGLGGFGNRRISELSGGEQQRVALARSLAVEPSVLLLDEPLSNLDARLRDRMRSELKTLQKKLGITTIFVTHDQKEALTMSDRIAVFNQGRCIQVGSPDHIYSKPETSFVAQFVGETNLFPVVSDDNWLSVSEQIKIPNKNRMNGRFISIRPQEILLSDSGQSLDYSFQAHIEDKQFNGFSTNYRARTGDVLFQVTVLNTSRSSQSYDVGDQARLSFSHDSLHILKE